jgi:hypothetical protein
MNPMRTSLEDRIKQYRILYEELNKSHRVKIKKLSQILGMKLNTTSKRLNEAFNLGYVTFPQLRKRSYANMKEYVYFVRCPFSFPLYQKYNEDNNVVYYAAMSGFANLWIISNKEIDIEGDVIFSGLRSDLPVL